MTLGVTPHVACFILLLLLPGRSARAQTDESVTADSVGIAIEIRSVQIDVTTIIFSYSIGISVDVDGIEAGGNAAGLRIGFDHIVNGGLEGAADGSPFNEAHLLARLTMSLAFFRWDVYGGLAAQWPNSLLLQFVPKAGMDLRFRILPPYFGLIVRVSKTFSDPASYGGVVGVYGGYEW